jgi:hypothetical protein
VQHHKEAEKKEDAQEQSVEEDSITEVALQSAASAIRNGIISSAWGAFRGRSRAIEEYVAQTQALTPLPQGTIGVQLESLARALPYSISVHRHQAFAEFLQNLPGGIVRTIPATILANKFLKEWEAWQAQHNKKDQPQNAQQQVKELAKKIALSMAVTYVCRRAIDGVFDAAVSTDFTALREGIAHADNRIYGGSFLRV